MPLPQKLTPREEAEQFPYALASRAAATASRLRVGNTALQLVAGKALVSHPEGATASAGHEMKADKAVGTMGEDDLDGAGRLVPDQGNGGPFSEPDKMRDARARQQQKAGTQEQAWRTQPARRAPEGGGDPSSMNEDIGGNQLVPRAEQAVGKAGHHNQFTDKNPEKQPTGKPGGGKAPSASVTDHAEAAAWRAAGGAAKLQAGLKVAFSGMVDKIKASPAALKNAVMHEIGLVKAAGQGIRAVVSGQKPSPEQKAAMRTVAVKVAVKVAFAAIGAALPGVGHVVGHAIEKIAPHAVEALAHHIAHHAAEHTIEHLVKHAAQHKLGVTFKDDVDDAQLFANMVLEGVQDGLNSLTNADWDQFLVSDGTPPTEPSSDDAPPGKPNLPSASAPPRVPAAKAPPPTPAKKNSPQLPGPDERVDGAKPGEGYTVREDTPVGYGVAAKAESPVMKKVTYQGIPVHVDRPVGYVQKGDGPDGPWERTYKLDYGYIPGTQGGDGQGLDVFLGTKPSAPDAHWAIQVDKDGNFDEYKVLFGFEDATEAEKAYTDHIPSKFLKAMRSTSVQQVRAILGLEPVEVLKALFADQVDAMLWGVDKASVQVPEHERSNGKKVKEHERRAPLGDEDKPKGEGPARGEGPGEGGLKGKSGGVVHSLRELGRAHDAGSAMRGVGNFVGAILQNRVNAAQARAKASSAAAAKAAADRAAGDKARDDKRQHLDDAEKEAHQHGQAAADHYDAARRAEDAGDTKAMDHHDEAAAGHARASNRIAAAVDAARKGNGSVDRVDQALEVGAQHAASVGKPPKGDAKSEGSDDGRPRDDDGKFTAKASLNQLSRDEMTRPYVPVIPAAEGDGFREGEDPAWADMTKSAEVQIVEKASDGDADERYVLGIVLIPEQVDSQGDIYNADEIKKTAHRWMADFRNIDLQHKVLINHLVEPVESYIAPVDMQVGGRTVKAGTWLLAAHVTDDDIWRQVKDGGITGWSISGLAKRTPVKQL